jgi:hypothetical protein
MIKVMISFILAYLMAGVFQVMEDLAADPAPRSFWALRPTVGQMIYAAATWVVRPFNEAAYSTLVANRVPFAFVQVAMPLAITAGFVWCCITVSVRLFDNMALQMAAVTALLIIGTRFVLPWLGGLWLPIALIITLPRDLLFPLKNAVTTANTDLPKPRPQSPQMTIDDLQFLQGKHSHAEFSAQPTEPHPLAALSNRTSKRDNSDLPRQLSVADETPSKTDYYPVIARAVSSLAADKLDARQALYDRARSALTAELQDYVPALTDAEIRGEQLALDIAIRKVESDFLQRAAHKIDQSFPPHATVAIRADAIRRLYDNKKPTRKDGVLGWVPAIADQLVLADAADDYVEISLVDWNANVNSEVREILNRDIHIIRTKTPLTDYCTHITTESIHDIITQIAMDNASRPTIVWVLLILMAGSHFWNLVRTAAVVRSSVTETNSDVVVAEALISFYSIVLNLMTCEFNAVIQAAKLDEQGFAKCPNEMDAISALHSALRMIAAKVHAKTGWDVEGIEAARLKLYDTAENREEWVAAFMRTVNSSIGKQSINDEDAGGIEDDATLATMIRSFFFGPLPSTCCQVFKSFCAA